MLPITTYDPLDSVSQFYDTELRGMDIIIRLGPGQKERVDSTIIQTYLPGIRKLNRNVYRGSYNIEPFFYRSEGVRSGRISHHALRHTFALLLFSLAHNVGTSEATNVDLSQMLTEAWMKDQQMPQLRAAQVFYSTFTRFVCLCEIATHFNSRRIRSVLCHFWTKHGESISRHEHPRALMQWASVILFSNMIESDIISCLHQIILGRPTILEEAQHHAVRDGSTRFMQVYENLRDIASRIDTGTFAYPYNDMTLDRGRSFVRRPSLSRRYSYSPFRIRSPLARVNRHRVVPRRFANQSRLLPPMATEVALRQDSQERRLRRLEDKVDAVQDVVEDGLMRGSFSPGYHSSGYYSDGADYGDYFDHLDRFGFDRDYVEPIDVGLLL
jgi:hypothetical protein